MKKYTLSPLFLIKWQIIQLLSYFLFLWLLHSQEIKAINFIGENNYHIRAIQKFLNQLQSPLLPDFFFFLFFPLVLISISLIVFKKWRWYFIALTGAIISILLTADKIYYSYFTSVISTESFLIANQAWDVKDAILNALTPADIFDIGIFGVFIIFGFIYNKKMPMSLNENKVAFTADKIAGILFFLVAIYCYNIAFYIPKRHVIIGADHVMRISKEKIDYNDRTYIPGHEASNKSFAQTFGIMNFHIKNLTDAIQEQVEIKEQNKTKPPENLNAFFERKNHLNETKSPFYGIAKGRNVFLIHFESLHPILIGLDIKGSPVTPTLNRISKDFLYWNYILDQVTIGGSSDAEFESITGMLPSTEKISSFNTSRMPHIPSLPRTLKSMGYQTISLHGYKSSYWNRNISHPLLGFKTLYFRESFNLKTKIGMGLADKDFFSQSVDLLTNHQPPFFAFLITLSSHSPYRDVPEEYQNLFHYALELNSQLGNYLQIIRYTDDALGDFFNKIKSSGLWENSIFIIYGDHQPAFDEQMIDDLMNISGKSVFNSRFLCVPLIIVIPGQEDLILKQKNKYQKIVGGLYDIFPTTMHLLGDNSPYGVFGTHLFVENNKRDPIPFFRFTDSFVFNGIHYREKGTKISKDELGIVFTGDNSSILKNVKESYDIFRKSLQAINYCNYILNSDTDIEQLMSKF